MVHELAPLHVDPITGCYPDLEVACTELLAYLSSFSPLCTESNELVPHTM